MIGLLLAIPGAVKRWAIIVALAIGALAATWLGGRKSARTNDKIKRAEAAAKATKDMNNVDTMRDADDDARIERLLRFERDNRP